MNETLKDYAEPELTEVIERNMIEQYPFIFGSLPKFEMYDTEELVWFTTGISHPYRTLLASLATFPGGSRPLRQILRLHP